MELQNEWVGKMINQNPLSIGEYSNQRGENEIRCRHIDTTPLHSVFSVYIYNFSSRHIDTNPLDSVFKTRSLNHFFSFLVRNIALKRVRLACLHLFHLNRSCGFKSTKSMEVLL